jgi:hypothetical protein
MLGARGNGPPYSERIGQASGYEPVSSEEAQVSPPLQVLSVPVGYMGDLDRVLLHTVGTVAASTLLLLILLCGKLSKRTMS